jgi:DUF971 family protein
MSATPDPEVFFLPDEDNASTRMIEISGVGAYALTIQWEDGHSYGIYNWNYLKALCPCAECRAGY